MDGWTPLIALHAAGATYSLVMGAVVLFLPAKGSLLHRRLGRSWMAAMYWTVLSSFGIQALRPGHFSWIHLLSIWTFISLSIALWAARTHRRQVHRQWVLGSYFGLCGAGLAALAFPQRLAPQLVVHHPLVFLAAVAGIAVLVVATVVSAGGRVWQQVGARVSPERLS
jgi:uncharacterized membrane protein